MSRWTVRQWLRDPERSLTDRRSLCFVCAPSPCPEPEQYGYLLGHYLGDEYLVTSARVPKLRIACADAYPVIASMVDAAMRNLSGNRTGTVHGVGCSDHFSYWTHWPCLFPQHGPGRKHERAIALADWQEQITARHPWPFVAGLLHSDGCRAINTVTVRGTTYRYPRWFFANESADILTLLGRALDSVGVRWRYNRANSISIARRESVALVDRHVGAKR